MTALDILLLAASVVRRLHDRGSRGAWGLMPVPFLLAGLVALLLVFTHVEQAGDMDTRLFGLIFLNNLVYLVLLATLVVLLCRGSDPWPNRYGTVGLQWSAS